MVEKPQINPDVPDVELHQQLADSRLMRAEAEQKLERADATASEVANIFRRLAAAIDRNPQTWDALLLEQRKQ